MTQPTSTSSPSDALVPALLLFGGVTLLLVATFALRPSQHHYSQAELTATAQIIAANQTATAAAQQQVALAATATFQAAQQVAQGPILDPAMVLAGENVFQSVCAACHGFNAKGIPGLGKPLIGSQFANSLSDDELLAFIQGGRAVTDPLNTTGVMMPPRGGNPNLTDDDLRHVIAYIRSLNAPSAAVAAAPTSIPATAGPTPTPIEFHPLPLAASGESVAVQPTSAPSLFSSDGQEWYVRSCSGCHGVDGRGLPNLAPSLAESTLLKNRDGIGLLTFLTQAQPPINPQVAYPHPYRGGYPELADAQIQQIIAYLYSLPAAGS